MRSVEQGIEWAKSPDARYRNGKSWAGWCLSFAYRFLGATGASRDTAYLAYKASGKIVSTDHAAAPKGAVHWWSDSGAGHVAVSLGNDVAAMASAGVTTSWGVATGTTTVTHYNSTHPGLKYLGWTYDFIGVKNPDVVAYLTKREQDAKDAAAKAAEKAAAAKAAAEKAEAEQEAAEKALRAAADEAKERPSALPVFVREKGDDAVYIIDHGMKWHVTKPVFQVWQIAGATVVEVPKGSLSAFHG